RVGLGAAGGLGGWGWGAAGGGGFGAGEGGDGEEEDEGGPAEGAVEPGAVAFVALTELVEEDAEVEVDEDGDGDSAELHHQPGAAGGPRHEDHAGDGGDRG